MEAVKKRYNNKIQKYCDNIDPYKIKKSDFDFNELPKNFTYFDLVEYLVERVSSYTKEQFKCYKNLTSYKYFENGWIEEMLAKKTSQSIIILSKVKHSQKLNQPALKCWLAISFQGLVLCAHCVCMAGLGEVCTHIAASLFALEYYGRTFSNLSCTDVKNKWLPPSFKTVPMMKLMKMKMNRSLF